MNNVSNNIRFYRKKAKLSQAELAKKTSVSIMSIRRYETGEREPTLSALNDIANALGIRPSDLIWPNETSENTKTIAAHFDGNEYTKEELDEIRQFAEFVKKKREKNLDENR